MKNYRAKTYFNRGFVIPVCCKMCKDYKIIKFKPVITGVGKNAAAGVLKNFLDLF